MFTGLGAFAAIGLLSLFEANFVDVALLITPFGAAAALVFGVPDSPLAPPKNVIVGHLNYRLCWARFYALYWRKSIYFCACNRCGCKFDVTDQNQTPACWR